MPGVALRGLGRAYLKNGGSPAWTRKEGKSESGGLNKKGVASYRAANPGSKLKTAVTTKPSKLKKGSDRILIKLPKKKQDLRMDLPTVGLNTLKDCKRYGFKGIVLKSKKNIFFNVFVQKVSFP